MTMIAYNNVEIARKWRQEQGRAGTGGVVVIYDGAVSGWVEELCDPGSWRPGCIAVDEIGKTWVAVGGNVKEGAREWFASK